MTMGMTASLMRMLLRCAVLSPIPDLRLLVNKIHSAVPRLATVLLAHDSGNFAHGRIGRQQDPVHRQSEGNERCPVKHREKPNGSHYRQNLGGGESFQLMMVLFW